MRIGVNGRFLAAPVTGVQRFAHEVVHRLARGSDVALFVPGGVAVPPSLSVDVVTGRLRGHAWEQLELPRALNGRCDVVLQPANTATLRIGVPYVLVLHDVLPLTDAHWFARLFGRWQRAMTPRAARGAARVVTVSEWSRGTICDVTGVDASRVLVARQGLAPFTAPASPASVAQVRARFALPPRFVLAVGADARKNTEFLAGMIGRWRQAYDDAPALVIVGSREHRVHGSTPAQARSGDADVRRVGRVTDEEMRALYTAALALCSASHAEGLGRPPLEAIGCGTPAVVAPYHAAGETLNGVASARVVPLDEETWIAALREVSRVPDGVRAADAAALRARWSWDTAADVVLQACRDAHADGSAAASRSTHRQRVAAGAGARRSTVRAVRDRAATERPDIERASGPTGSTPRIALVHDWLTGTRGGERVLEALVALLPGADLFTLIHVPGSVPPAIEALDVRTSFLNALPGVRHYYRHCLPLFPTAIERFDLSGYDIVVSSSHCVAKAVDPRGARHLCYCHTPMRYAWDQRAAYLGGGPGAVLRGALLAPVLDRLRQWDAATAHRVDAFVANSENVRGRIRQHYGRDANVVYPPVDIDRFTPAREREDVHVCAGALVPYKRVDVAVAAFNRSGRRLLVVGDGPAYRALRRQARSNIEFTGRVSDAELAGILGRARSLIMPMVEDFGIIAVEAQAAGAPVIAYGAGGALESVIDGVTGLHFPRQTPASLDHAVIVAERIQFDGAALRRNAERFGTSVFNAAMTGELARLGAVDATREASIGLAASCT